MHRVRLLAFSNVLKRLVNCGGHSSIFVDLRPLKQQMVRCTTIYNVKIRCCSYGPYGQVNVDVAKGMMHASKAGYLDRLSTIFSRGVSTTSSVDRGIMCKEDSRSINARLIYTSGTIVVMKRGLLWYLGKIYLSFL